MAYKAVVPKQILQSGSLINTQLRYFSQRNDNESDMPDPRLIRAEQNRNRIDQEQREKLKKAPEMDTAEDVSFQDNYMYLKWLFFSTLFGAAVYQTHKAIKERFNLRQARLEGRLLEYEQMKYEKRKQSLRGKVFGVEQDAPIKQ